MLEKIISNPILFYGIFTVLSILIFLILFLVISKISKSLERKKLKNTSDIILNEHFEEAEETSLEEEINKLEEKAKQNDASPLIETFEVENKFVKGEPIQIEINSEIDDKKYDMESILSRMQEDLTKRDEQKIFEFEQEQEENAIISYQELLKINGKDVPKTEEKKFDLIEFFENMSETPKHSYSLNNFDEAEDLSVITIDEVKENKELTEYDIGKEIKELKNNINNVQVSNIEIEVPKEKKKFKMSEFISPIYGRMETKLEYPTIPSSNGKSISELKDDEFLDALKAFRQNL